MKKQMFEDYERKIRFAGIMLLLVFAMIDLFLIYGLSDIKFAQLLPAEKLVIALLYVLIAAMNIGALAMPFLKKRELEQFMKLHHVTREELLQEVQTAEELVAGWWYVGVNYTCIYEGISDLKIPIFIKNLDIMSMTYKTIQSQGGLNHYIRLRSLTDKKERDLFCANEEECRKVRSLLTAQRSSEQYQRMQSGRCAAMDQNLFQQMRSNSLTITVVCFINLAFADCLILPKLEKTYQ